MKYLIILICFITLSLTGCDSPIVYSECVSLDGPWAYNQAIVFDYNAKDTLKKKDLFILIRNDEYYPYSNLFLITEMEMPDQTKIIDTLEYEMANPDGSWKGHGFSGYKESKLWYKENVVFPKIGEYKFKISQAMRNLNEVEGIQLLEGITDVGLQIENHHSEK